MTATHPVDSAPPPVQRARPLGIAAVGALAALCYGVLVGGTTLSELDPTLRLLTAAVAGLFVLVYVLKAPGQADRVDQGVLLALLFLVGAAVMSQFPRQSFDAALGALALTAILFIARGQLAREEPRIVFIRVLVGLSALLTAITAARWLSEALAWWSLTNWTVVPPLNLNLSSVPWGHRHDLTLLLAMLYPAWWMGNPAPIRRAAAAVVGGLTILIVIVDGSRMLWLAMAVATAVLLVPPLFRWLQRRGWSPFVMISGLVVAAGMLAAVGLRIGIVDRLLNLESLAWRSEMWVALFDTWLAHPIAGLGPGSFPWVLQQTDYFVTNSWAPRHPDSVFFQLIAEAGILGIAALGTLVITLGLAVFRGRSTAAAWALTTFAVAGLGSNPTDFGFLLVLAVGWAAYAVPRDRGAAGQGERRFSPTRAITLTALAVVGAAYTMTLAAGFAYEAARREVTGGDFPQARAPLDAAIALDPGLALYPRQRGTLSYVEGNAAAGIPDLEWATQLNPSDDLAWRTLALAYASVGDQDAAESALDKAVSDQRSDPSNMLLSAYWHGRDGRTSEARAILAELVRAWPATVAAVGWSDILPTSITTTQVIDDAVERWLQGSPYPESFSGQGIWLAVLGSRPDLLDVAIDELGVSDGLANATIAVFTCDPQGGIYLDQLAESDRRTQLYWHLRLRDSARNGSPDEGAARIIGITSGDPIDFARSVETLNPLLENGWAGFSADIWGYRRWWIEWPADEIQLPDPEAGAIRWLLDPAGATRDAGLEDRLPGCA